MSNAYARLQWSLMKSDPSLFSLLSRVFNLDLPSGSCSAYFTLPILTSCYRSLTSHRAAEMAHEIPFRAGSSSNSNEYMSSIGTSSQASTWEGEREGEQTSEHTSTGTTALSCFQCRARKVKCDRLKPACSRCVRLGDECVFPNSRQKRLTKKKNPSVTLEARLGG